MPLLMLGIAGLGSVAGVVRAVVLEGPQWWSFLKLAVFLLAPVGVVAAYAMWTARQSPQPATWGGVTAACAAAIFNVVALAPEANRDANTGLGLYAMFGWLFPLAPAFLVGGLLAALVERQRGKPPAPAALEDARPLPPLRPWLWPLVVPAVAATAVRFAPLLPGGVGVYREELLRFVLVQSVFLVGTLPVGLSPALMALLALRGRAARDGVLRPRLAAFWGLCLGLSVTPGLFGFGAGLLGRVPLEVYILVCAAPPIAGDLLGRWAGIQASKS